MARAVFCPATSLALAVFALACGSVGFGEPRAPVGAELDGGTDAGSDIPDVLALPDVPDVGIEDAGCREIPDPAAPTTWPFARTAAAYQEEFWTLANDKGCNRNGPCHNYSASGVAPRISATVAEIANQLDTELDGVWSYVAERDVDGMLVRPILYNHTPIPSGLGKPQVYDRPIIEAIEAFIARGEQCGWVPTLQSPPMQPPGCGDPPDAGEPDLGLIDAAPDDGGPVDTALDDGGPIDAGLDDGGPIDAGLDDAGLDDAGLDDAEAGGPPAELCWCALPELDISHCAQ